MVRPLVILAFLAGCSDYKLNAEDDTNDSDIEDPYDTNTEVWDDIDCTDIDASAKDVGVTDECSFEIGNFNPVVSWEDGEGKSSTALPIVADINGDGMPEILINETSGLGLGKGSIVVYEGDGSGKLWENTELDLGYGASFSVADLDGDGQPEIVAVREYASSMSAKGDYTAIALDNTGNIVWESAHFLGDDFDYAAQPIIADMDADGTPEVILGRVILRADGSTRGVGQYGRGCYGTTPFGQLTFDESAAPAVVDLDLDGQMEVIVGNAMYNADGVAIWHDSGANDGMISVANLDDDPEGEFVGITGNTIWAKNTNGAYMWGPTPIASANILAPVGIQDLDGDGSPELVTAGGNELIVLHADGSTMWTAAITDESGASGASFFDFEGDGDAEVVYIDEVQLIAFNGRTGDVKFQTDHHQSPTMMDYPTIADVDADGHADIVVAHVGLGVAFSVFSDAANSWAPARTTWNQHAYSVMNINDDLTVPTEEIPGFTTFNNWHSAMDREAGQGPIVDDLEAQVVGSCADDCDQGMFHIVGRIVNRGEQELPAGVPLSLYARKNGADTLLETKETTLPTPSGLTGEPIEFDVAAEDIAGIDNLWLSADDAGGGHGRYAECSETNNRATSVGPFCD